MTNNAMEGFGTLLPDVLVFCVFVFLPVTDMVSAYRVCNHWKCAILDYRPRSYMDGLERHIQSPGGRRTLNYHIDVLDEGSVISSYLKMRADFNENSFCRVSDTVVRNAARSFLECNPGQLRLVDVIYRIDEYIKRVQEAAMPVFYTIPEDAINKIAGKYILGGWGLGRTSRESGEKWQFSTVEARHYVVDAAVMCICADWDLDEVVNMLVAICEDFEAHEPVRYEEFHYEDELHAMCKELCKQCARVQRAHPNPLRPLPPAQ